MNVAELSIMDGRRHVRGQGTHVTWNGLKPAQSAAQTYDRVWNFHGLLPFCSGTIFRMSMFSIIQDHPRSKMR